MKCNDFGRYTVDVEEYDDADYGRCIKTVWKNSDGELHHPFGEPAITTVQSATDRTITQEWYKNDQLHREGAPARITHWWKEYEASPTSITEEWFINDVAHRMDGPAVLEQCSNGVVAYEKWIINGKTHRNHLPALTSRDYETGEILYQEWYQHGEETDPSIDGMSPV